MTSAHAKQKGCEYERKTAKRLSQWVSNHARVDVFWRSAMSGGRATVHQKRQNRDCIASHAGDITCTHSCGELLTKKFIFECKFYKSLELERVVFGTKQANLRLFFKTLKKIAKVVGKEPIVIAKQNFKPDLCVVGTKGYEMLSCMGKIPILATFKGDMIVFLFRDLITLPFEKFRQRYSRKSLKREKLIR